MRPPAILACLAITATALVAAPAPAQASTGTIKVDFSESLGAYVLTALPGISAFAPGEELQIIVRDGHIRVQLLDGDHILTPGKECNANLLNPTKDIACFPYKDVRKVYVDFRAASGATTTAVSRPDPSADPLNVLFYGGSGPDEFYSADGDDQLEGKGGDDNLFGGDGNDYIAGGDGDDDVWGEAGNDNLNGESGNDYVSGEEGVDVIVGGPGTDTLDSEDGIKDALVDCMNTPGQGAITYDVDLDWPYNCPVTLAPTEPRDVQASSGSASLEVRWAAPAFDGNSAVTSYTLRMRPPGSKEWSDKTISIPPTKLSHTLTGLALGEYALSLRAENAKGTSEWTNPVTVTVSNAPAAPKDVGSFYVKASDAGVHWVAPTSDAVVYEVALRTRKVNERKWASWESLPKLVKNTTLDVADLLSLSVVQGRIYQFRVRTIAAGDTTLRSSWTPSATRFAGGVSALRGATLSFASSSAELKGSVLAPGPAWSYNVELSGMSISVLEAKTASKPIAEVTRDSTTVGYRYSATFTNPEPGVTLKKCFVTLTAAFAGTKAPVPVPTTPGAQATCPR